MGDVTITGPISGGRHNRPFGRPLVDLDAHGVVEAEYLLEGESTKYRHVGEMTRDGKWSAEPAGSAPFRTRVVVYRPRDPDAFNGTVVVMWNNVTAGYDLFGGESAELLEGGYAYVCVTTQRVGIEGLDPARLGLTSWDPDRYGSLHHPGDDYSFDIFTQAARAVGADRPRTPVDPLGGLDVKRVFAMGASQSAGRLLTYLNAIHPLTHAFDAYLPQIWFGTGTSLEVGDAVLNIYRPTPDSGAATRTRLFEGAHQVRDDLDVPVMVVNSELESIPCFDVRQPDTDRFRYWEAAGTCHVSAQAMLLRAPKYERDFGRPLPYPSTINRIPLQPLYDAALRHLVAWVDTGTPPPAQPRIEFATEPRKEIRRDELGIARGGIRLPQAEVPIARNSCVPLGRDVTSILYGSSEPFSPEQVRELYGDRATYLARFEEAARAAEKAGVLLARDVEALVAEAEATCPI